jgi:hypothetical protein
MATSLYLLAPCCYIKRSKPLCASGRYRYSKTPRQAPCCYIKRSKPLCASGRYRYSKTPRQAPCCYIKRSKPLCASGRYRYSKTPRQALMCEHVRSFPTIDRQRMSCCCSHWAYPTRLQTFAHTGCWLHLQHHPQSTVCFILWNSADVNTPIYHCGQHKVSPHKL